MGKNANKSRIYELEQPPQQDKRKFTDKDLCSLSARSDNQSHFVNAYFSDYNTETFALLGYPGTGKSYLALRCALDDVLSSDTDYERVVIFRSQVELRESGFKPGTEEDKEAPFAKPYISLTQDVFKCNYQNIYNSLKASGKLLFETTSNQRGVTYDNAIMIVDECQNMNYEELRTIYTRSGQNCRVIFCGDKGQNDLFRKKNDKSGLDKWVQVLENMPNVGITYFDNVDDIVRSGRIKDMVKAEIKLDYI